MGLGKPFDRLHFPEGEPFTYLGSGELGGKASGLAFIHETLKKGFPEGHFEGIRVGIPRMTVLRTDLFAEFLDNNRLSGQAWNGSSDGEISWRFQKADLPSLLVGDLYSLISQVHTPLAVRSSSLLEDVLERPFAGVYATKMIPNNAFDTEHRFRSLAEAIKFVYASTFFRKAREYAQAVGTDPSQAGMGVIIQEVVGSRYGERYYPAISGVARSLNYYPFGGAQPEEGVANLALGLGKTIVEGGQTWSYCVESPQAPPPYSSFRELLESTQSSFWAVFLGKPQTYDPIHEEEYLFRGTLKDAEEDEVLRHLCSTYDAESDRLVPGCAPNGPRLLDFSPILKLDLLPLNRLIRALLDRCRERIGAEVEMEFALTIGPEAGKPASFGFLQVRPAASFGEQVSVDLGAIAAERLLIYSDRVLGNGKVEGIEHILYLKPGDFQPSATREAAAEVADFNARMRKEKQPYLLIGFGRWGSSDPWLGVPVSWAQISEARAIVETTLPGMSPDLSQGSHFFHNVSGLKILYFCVEQSPALDWKWLDTLPSLGEGRFARLVKSPTPLQILADGRKGIGVIVK